MPKTGHVIRFDRARASVGHRDDGKLIDKGVRNILVLLAICLGFLTVVVAHRVVNELKPEDDMTAIERAGVVR